MLLYPRKASQEQGWGNIMQYEKIWYLKQFKLFEGFTQEQMNELNRITCMKRYKKGQPIYFPGDPSGVVYLLKQGRVKICKTSETGKSVTLALLEHGEIFGEVEVLGGVPRSTFAQSLDAFEDVLVCEILHEDFERYLHDIPEISAKIFKIMGYRIQQIETRMSDLVFRTAPARLANLFLRLAETMGAIEPDGIGIRLKPRLTHKNLADLVGTARETVSFILGDFAREGLTRQHKSYITILDKEGLSQVK